MGSVAALTLPLCIQDFPQLLMHILSIDMRLDECSDSLMHVLGHNCCEGVFRLISSLIPSKFRALLSTQISMHSDEV